MFKILLCGQIFLLITTLRFDNTYGQEIVELIVPQLADPRENATFSCKYDMGAETLYFAKWFKNNKEIFRFMPRVKQAPNLKFSAPGVKFVKTPNCSITTCDMVLTEVNPITAGEYACEVSAEVPRLPVARKSSKMAVAALPRKDPILEGLKPNYDIGEEIEVTCVSDLSLPPANITWYINDVEATFLDLDELRSSDPDQFGLVRVSLTLRFTAERRHFSTGSLRVRCSSLLPDYVIGSPHRRQAIGVATLHQPTFLDKFSWFSSGSEINNTTFSLLFCCLLAAFLGTYFY